MKTLFDSLSHKLWVKFIIIAIIFLPWILSLNLVPKYGYILYSKTDSPVKGAHILVRHSRDYRWTLGMEKLSGQCTLLNYTVSSSDGRYGIGRVPISRQDIISLRKVLSYKGAVYIPLEYNPENGIIEKIYEAHWPPKVVTGRPPTLKVYEKNFNIVSRIQRISDFLFLLTDTCQLSEAQLTELKNEIYKLVAPEVRLLFPLWLAYLSNNPYPESTSGMPYDPLKIKVDVLFIRVMGDSVRSKLNAASYPNATEKCPYLYRGIEKPQNITLDKDACFR
ncbi:hypothetical protein [uncultured Microbulbifer sp.]|uniref:hypothetical protein n=1 Tax=uncultured Microbulbifer sp. TaxID=348147 RepID=UPI0026312F46|nr:hypothetical protein [uncultured Microbulbifer sp.]